MPPRLTALFFLFFSLSLAFYTACSYRPRLKPFIGDVVAAEVAYAVGTLIYALHGFFYFGYQFALPVLYAQDNAIVGLLRCPVSRVGKILTIGLGHIAHRLARSMNENVKFG